MGYGLWSTCYPSKVKNYDGIDLLSKKKGKITRYEPQFRVSVTIGMFPFPVENNTGHIRSRNS